LSKARLKRNLLDECRENDARMSVWSDLERRTEALKGKDQKVGLLGGQTDGPQSSAEECSWAKKEVLCLCHMTGVTDRARGEKY